MPGILIIACGNPLRRDDGFGPEAARRLREAYPGLDIVIVHQLTPELMEPISRAGRVIFLDASAEGEPGTLLIRDLAPAATRSAFTHTFTPAALLAGAAALYGATPAAVLITAGGLDFELGEGLSEPVQAALESLVQHRIRALLNL